MPSPAAPVPPDWDPRAWRRTKRIRAAVLLGGALAVALLLIGVGGYLTSSTVEITGVTWGPAIPSPGPACSGQGLSAPETTSGGTYAFGSSVTFTVELYNSDPTNGCHIANVTVALSGISGDRKIESASWPGLIFPVSSSPMTVTIEVPIVEYSGSVGVTYFGSAVENFPGS